MNHERLEELLERIKAFAQGKNGTRYRARFSTSDVSQEAAIQLVRLCGNDQQVLDNVNSSWLKRVAFGHSKTLREHHSARKRSVDAEQSNTQIQASDQNTPEQQAISNEMTMRVALALRNLQREERLIFDRYHARNKSFNSIAREMGCPSHTVRRIYHNALKKLKADLK